MRVEVSQGTYRIRPNSPQAGSPAKGAAALIKGNSTPPNSITPAPTAPNQSDTIQRGPDVAQLSALSLQAALQNLPQIDRFHAKMSPLIAGQTNRPMSFDASPPAKSMNIYDRAYFRHTADHASLNAAAVEKSRLDLQG